MNCCAVVPHELLPRRYRIPTRAVPWEKALKTRRSWVLFWFAVAILILLQLGRAPQPKQSVSTPVQPVGNYVEIKAPLGLPPVLDPADNPPSAETISLRRRLYKEGLCLTYRSGRTTVPENLKDGSWDSGEDKLATHSHPRTSGAAGC